MMSVSACTSRRVGARSASTRRRRSTCWRVCSASAVSTGTVRAPRRIAIDRPAATRSASGSSMSSANRRNTTSGSCRPSPAASRRTCGRMTGWQLRHRGVDRADRLLAGHQHVAHVLDPRGERVEAGDLRRRRPVAPLDAVPTTQNAPSPTTSAGIAQPDTSRISSAGTERDREPHGEPARRTGRHADRRRGGGRAARRSATPTHRHAPRAAITSATRHHATAGANSCGS